MANDLPDSLADARSDQSLGGYSVSVLVYPSTVRLQVHRLLPPGLGASWRTLVHRGGFPRKDPSADPLDTASSALSWYVDQLDLHGTWMENWPQ